MTLRYSLVPGVLVEPVGALWAAFSPASNETCLLNDESAAVLEVLQLGTASTESVCAHLAADVEMEPTTLHSVVDACWSVLVDAGLVRAKSGLTVPQ